MNWTKLPFRGRNREEFSAGLTDWLGRVFYDILPARGYEVREEQIYTAFRMARALTDGKVLLAEAGPGTGKTFAYLLPAVCYARFRGKPAVVASASGVLQTQLTHPTGDIQTLSRLLDLHIDARLALDPGAYICKVKVNRAYPGRRAKGWKALSDWARRTTTGARSEVPDAPDELWSLLNWEPSLPCDTCVHRGTCHPMAARRHYRAAADLIVTDHRLFATDLLTRAERQSLGQMPLLPAYSAAVLDEGHHLPEIWQRSQGHRISARALTATLESIRSGYGTGRSGMLAEARHQQREHLGKVLLTGALQASDALMATVLAAAEPGEGKRHIHRTPQVTAAATALTEAIERLQDELTTEEAMQEGTDRELTLRAYQSRLDQVLEALNLFQAADTVPWVENDELWVVPREPLTLFGEGRLAPATPLLFSSATLEAAYTRQTLQLKGALTSQVGVPFNLAEQVLVYRPPTPVPVADVIRAMQGRCLVLATTMAEVEEYRAALAGLPWHLLVEGDAERGAMLKAFREDLTSVLVGATFWEGVDIPGEPLSCVIIPRLPFPPHDPLIKERRRQAEARGEEPFTAVDVPEMLLKLKQGAGRLIRTARDRGVLAILDPSYPIDSVLPEGAEQTESLERVTAFCPTAGSVPSPARGRGRRP